MENETSESGTVDQALSGGRERLSGIAQWFADSPGEAALVILALLAVVAAAFLFYARVARMGRRVPVARGTPGAAADGTMTPKPAKDVAAQRRLAGAFFALDRIGGSRRKPAKRALMAGQTKLARAVFETEADDHPDDCARGLALVAEMDGDTEAAARHYARMHEMQRAGLGPRHPQTRQGAVLYAAFLRATAPDDPALADLESLYGDGIGR